MKFSLPQVIGLSLLLLFAPFVQAQNSKTLEGVLKLRLRNSGPIIDQTEIKGYYMFYQEDKIARGEFAYQLHILDADLNTVATKSIVGTKNLMLAEGAYNGNSIMLKFLDFRNDVVRLQRYGLDGQLIQEYESEFGNFERLAYLNLRKEELEGTSLHSVPGQGFVHYRFVKDPRYMYIVEFYPNEGEPWSQTPPPGVKLVQTAAYLGHTDDLLISNVAKKKGLNSRKMDNFVMGTDLKSGKRLFEVKMENSDFDIQILSVAPYNPDRGIELLGLYFKLGDNVMKDPSLGFCRVNIDEQGNLKSTDLISWATDVAKVLPVNQKGKIKGIGYVYFHDMITDAEGDIYLIGEQFKKTVSGAGLALNALSNNQAVSNFQLTVDDMMIFHLSPEFELKGVDIFAKSKSRVLLPPGYGLVSPQILATVMKQFGAFDYAFTQQSPDNKVFTVGFIDWDREGKGKNQLVFGAITRNEGAYALDKISLETRATDLQVQPGKPGYIVIFEYLKRERQLELRLEQINY